MHCQRQSAAQADSAAPASNHQGAIAAPITIMPKKKRLDDDREAVRQRMQAGEEMDCCAVWRSSDKASKSWARDVLKQWHDEQLVHISRWERGIQGPPAPFYKWGQGKDAPRPTPLGNAAAVRKWQKNHPDKVQERLRKVAAVRRKTPLLDPIHAALLGYKRHGNAWIKKNEIRTTDTP